MRAGRPEVVGLARVAAMRVDLRSFVRSFKIAAGLSASLLLSGVALGQETTPPAAGATPEATAGAANEVPELNLKDSMEKGEAALKAGDFENALKIYAELLRAANANQASPDALAAQVAGLVGRGRALVGLKEFDAALDDYNNIINNFDPANVPALIARGQLRLEKNEPDLALNDFQAVTKVDRGNVEAQYGLGKALVLLSRAEEALAPLSRVIAADPQNAEAYRYRGSANANVFKLKQAIEDLNQSISLNPDDHETYATLAIVYRLAEDFPQSVEQFQKAIEHYKPMPGQEDVPNAQGHFALAAAYTELGKHSKDAAARKAAFEAAINESNKLMQLLGDKNPLYGQARAQALYTRGVAERMLGEYGTAIRSFSQALELAPETGEIYFRRGICFHMLGEERLAISDFERASHMSQDDPRCDLWAGVTYAKLGEYHKAVKEYGDALAVSDRYTPAYANRALAYWMLGEYDKAIADINEAIRLDPTNAEYYYKRGRAHERLGDHQEASESYATALEFNSKHADAHRHMATVQQSLGRSELAVQYRQRADELDASAKQKQ
jgi:tetratricopeptide (TPR) repeat protein